MTDAPDSAPFPWQLAHWRGLRERHGRGRLPHALLLTGPAGTGKEAFGRALAAGLLCSEPDAEGRPCGACMSCKLAAAGAHPDLLWVAPQEDSKFIRIDQVRALIAALGLKSQFGGHRIAVVTPAECMNAAAANSLLKTLEEPGPETLLLVITALPGRLPATVRSRCQLLRFPLPEPAAAAPWLAGQGVDAPERLLAAARGAPLDALRLAREDGLARRDALFADFRELLQGRGDPVALAQRWGAGDPGQCLAWLQGWVADLVRLRASPQAPRLLNEDLRRDLQGLSAGVDWGRLFAELDRLRDTARLLQSAVGAQTLLEQVLIPLRNGTGGR